MRFSVFVGLLFGLGVPALAAGYGFDVGSPPAVYAAQLAGAGLTGSAGGWMRVRGLNEERSPEKIAAERAGLLAVRARGVQTMVHLRWDPKVWLGGTRPGGGHRLPLDLREAFARGRWLALTYGDGVAGWEIENEPDIDFVAENPETYAAFLKAIYLGLKRGARDAELGAPSPGREGRSSDWLARKRGGAWFGECNLPRRAPLVLMAPLALPPGPYFERLWANGLASYTEGFNFHYYGYAADFTGVYRQFETAVRELGAESLEPGGRREWPVFMTEYGYGLLDAAARQTVAGRVRQWQWFADVARQLHALRPAGPMAFLVNPYYEAGLNEFGLTQPIRPDFNPQTSPAAGAAAADLGGTPPPAPTGALSFTPEDFGARAAEPWMRRIGQPLGDNFASPALAYLWDYAQRHPYRPRSWSVRAPAPSPVVVDFIAESGLDAWKSGGGYLLRGAAGPAVAVKQRAGLGRVVLYNFADKAIAGRWEVTGGAASGAVVLAAGERRELPVELTVPGDRFEGNAWRVTFTPEAASGPRAQWETRLYPDTAGLKATRVARFDFTAGQNRERAAGLQKRSLAAGEPGLSIQGRWLVTAGVRVEEVGERWRFHIDRLPDEPLRPAMVELPLPAGLRLDPGMLVVLERRLRPARLAGGAGETRPSGGVMGAMMDVYFRTENGNLYQTWPRLRMTAGWESYAERADNFTMGFFGRAELPWRFFDNRPVSLVFFLRPAELPTVFEVRRAHLVRLGAHD